MNMSFQKMSITGILFFYLCFVIFSFASFVSADTSNIAKIAFTTPEQTIKPNEVSKEITIQIQDSSGNKVVALETIRFSAFQSTSATGVFVSCTTPTNPPTDYLSKSSSNKNICYKDPTEGVYTLTAKTSNTATPLEVTQKITISSSASSATSTNTGTSSDQTETATTTTSTSTSQTTTDTSNSNNLVYSSYASLSTSNPIRLNVEVGRERVTFLHSPIEFKAKAIDKTTGNEVYDVHDYWSFGDGTSAEGSTVLHTYVFPGDYTVVLNSSARSDDAVDMTKVRVVEPHVTVAYADKYIEISNQLNEPVNIGGWKFKGEYSGYTLPRDTILSERGTVKVPLSALGRVAGNAQISLFYPDGVSVAELSRNGDEKEKQVVVLRAQLGQLQTELANIYATNEPQQDIGDETQGTSRLISSGDVASSSRKPVGARESLAGPLEAEATKGIVTKVLEFFTGIFK